VPGLDADRDRAGAGGDQYHLRAPDDRRPGRDQEGDPGGARAARAGADRGDRGRSARTRGGVDGPGRAAQEAAGGHPGDPHPAPQRGPAPGGSPRERAARRTGARVNWSLGIDFGTSYTVAAVATGSAVNAIDVESNGRDRIPSAVYLTQDAEILVGTAAQ